MLLEREDLLSELTNCLARAESGQGSLVLIAGEAGSGKTSLARAFVDSLDDSTLVIQGACDPLSTPRPLGPLYDFAANDRAGLSDLISGDRESMEIFHEVLDRLRHSLRPVVMVIEDIHWADDGTLDLLRFLGRRVGEARAMVLCTYRDDEVGPDHPLRPVLGQLIPLTTTNRLPVPLLSLEAVATLAGDRDIDTAELFRATDGNAFFVTEVLASGEGLPHTVQEAVLARVSRLSPGSRRIVEGVSVAPRSLEIDHASAIVGGRLDDIDDALSAGVLIGDGKALRFRHELARSAVEESMPLARKLSLHRRMLALLEEDAGTDDARLAHHAMAARDAELLARYAPVAARDAAKRGSHKEAVSFYESVIEHSASVLDPDEIAELRTELSWELGIVDRQEDALYQARLAADHFRATGQPARRAVALIRLAAAQWRLHDRPGSRVSTAEAVDLLEEFGPSRDLAYAHYHAAHYHMLARHGELADHEVQRTIEVAEEVGADDVLWMAEMMTGTTKIVIGQAPEGMRILQEVKVKAEQAGDRHGVSVALSMLGSGGGEARLYDAALAALEEGIAHDRANDQDYSVAYSRAWQARIAFEQGRWDDAVERAELVQRTSPSETGIATTTALAALGRVRVRRGDPGGRELLEKVLEHEHEHEIQHVWSPIAGLAEYHWLRGRRDEMEPVLADGYRRALDTDSEWARGELGFWMWRADAIDGPPPGAAEPFRLQMEGHWREAAEVWREIGCPYEVALALGDGDATAKFEALQLFDDLGARPAGDLTRSQLREMGVESIPRGPTSRTRGNPASLTNRQLEVLSLIADGLSNGEIAERLYISQKTVEHHVSAVYVKLGVSDRQAAMISARDLLES